MENLVLQTRQDELLSALDRLRAENLAEKKARLAEKERQERKEYELARIEKIHNAFIYNFIKLSLSFFNLKIEQLANLEGKLEELDELIMAKIHPWIRIQKFFFCLFLLIPFWGWGIAASIWDSKSWSYARAKKKLQKMCGKGFPLREELMKEIKRRLDVERKYRPKEEMSGGGAD